MDTEKQLKILSDSIRRLEREVSNLKAISPFLHLVTREQDFSQIPVSSAKFKFPADATDPTGGGAVGRIPIKIGANTKYIAYY